LNSLRGIESLKKLTYIGCSHNCVTSLKELSSMKYLQEIDCSHNRLTSLKELSSLENLQILKCHWNSISSLDGLMTMDKLKEFNCIGNCLQSFKYLPEIVSTSTFGTLNEIDELSGTSKFRILKEEKKSPFSWIHVLTDENLYLLHLFF